MVATDVGGTREIFTPDAHAARLVPPNDPELLAGAVLELLRNQQQRQHLAKAARCRVAEVCPPEVVMLGLIANDVAEAPESAVITNCCNTPVSALVSGWTRLTPAIVIMSPCKNVVVPVSTVNVAPVCDAPFTK